jgi:hypothetical protein
MKRPQFIVDEKGNRTGVILDMQSYEELLDAVEELEDIRAYDEAKALNEEAIPLEQAIKEIEDARK